MISFILNETPVNTDKPAGMNLLDFIRNEVDLKATKIGCREGDCGACTILEGRLDNGKVTYQTIVSCLTPLGNVNGRHIVTTEGINQEHLSPVQEALVEQNGTQCGFCTPGFVISLTYFLISRKSNCLEDAIKAIDGNICRCTGYKSIVRAAEKLVELKIKSGKNDPIPWLITNGYLPKYFKTIPEKLNHIHEKKPGLKGKFIIGGGTDLMVQKPDEVINEKLFFYSNTQRLKGIKIEDGICSIGAGTVATEIMESTQLADYFPNLKSYFKLVSSTPIRNMGTLAGNLANASPIGDLTIFFLALNAKMFLINTSGNQRNLLLKDFFIDYKKLNKSPGEHIEKISFKLPEKESFFNFEKVSKRQFLDIASVNSAIGFKFKNKLLTDVHLSAGGVSPVPLYLKNTSEFLSGSILSAGMLQQANAILQDEISPITDIRGSAGYKRLLLRQLFYAHFIELLPDLAEPSKLIKLKHV